MTLFRELTLVELETFPGRHRSFQRSTTSIFPNSNNTVLYEDFQIIKTSLQPLDGHTLQALSEGYRERAVYQFWTETPVVGLKEESDELSDQIEIDGEWYSIYNLKPWKRTTFISHYHCVAIREKANNSRDPNNTTGGNYG